MHTPTNQTPKAETRIRDTSRNKPGNPNTSDIKDQLQAARVALRKILNQGFVNDTVLPTSISNSIRVCSIPDSNLKAIPFENFIDDCSTLPLQNKPIFRCELCNKRVAESECYNCIQCKLKVCHSCKSPGTVLQTAQRAHSSSRTTIIVVYFRR